MSSAIDPTKPVSGQTVVKSQLRANFAAAKNEIEALQAGGITFPAGQLGEGTVARSMTDELRDIAVPVTRFGAIAGGSAATNNAAFQAAANEGIPISIPSGVFALSDELDITEPNTKFIGRHRKHSRIVSSYPFVFRLREGADNFHCRDLGLESTDDTATDLFFGLIYSNNESINGITIERCYFTAPDANTNALGLYADKSDGTNMIQNIRFLDNIVEEMGNSGICLQNHKHDVAAWRIRNFWIERNLFKSLGQANSDYGMGATLTGRVANGWVRDNILDDILGIGLEMANGNYNVHFLNNGFRNITRRGYGSATNPIACSSNQSPKIPHYSCVIAGNYSEAGATVEGGLFFGNMEGLILSNNSFDLEDNVSFRDVNDMSGVGNKFRCQAAKGMVLEGTSGASCKRNVLRDTQVDMSSRGSAVTSVVSFEGTSGSCDANRLVGGLLTRPSGGGAYVLTNDASNSRNVVEQMSTGAEAWAPRLKTITLSDADQSLTLIDIQYENLRLTGTLTATRTVTFPREGRWTVHNNTTGGQSVSCGPAGGTGLTITNGSRKVVQTRTGDTVDSTPA